MAEDKTIIELAPVLHLPPVDTEQMQPHALDRYLDFLKEVYSEVPVDELREEDLTDGEKAKRKQHTDKIAEWVQNCNKASDEAALRIYPYSTAVINYMDGLKALLETVHRRKVRLGALEAIDPPYEDAEKYLSQQEYDSFLGSLVGAADGYLTKGRGCLFGDWRLHEKAHPYAVFAKRIEERKEEEARQKQAQLEHDHFVKEINDAEKRFRQQLAKEKKPKFSYPKWLVDYHPNLWCELALPTEQQIEDWARPQIQERVPLALREFVEWDLSLQVQTLPDGKYEVVGIPCLTWCFTVLGLVKVHLGLVEKEIVKEFHGYRYPMKTDAEELGHFYLGPALGGHQEGFTTPIALLTLLAKGELEGLGIKAIKHSFPLTTFTIQGFDEEVQVHKDFRKFIIDMGKDGDLSDALLAKHVIDQTSATLMKEKAKLPLPQPIGGEVTVGESASDNSDVVAALEVMGFKKMEIKAGIEAAHLSPGMSLEEKIKAVLKSIDS